MSSITGMTTPQTAPAHGASGESRVPDLNLPLPTQVDEALTLMRRISQRPLDGSVSDQDLLATVQRLEALVRSCEGTKLTIVAEIAERQTHRGHHAATTEDLLATTLHMSRGQARAQAELAEGLRTVPKVAEALADGRLGVAQAAVAVRKVEQLKDRDDSAELIASLDATAARAGQTLDQGRLSRLLDNAVATAAPDALKSREDRAYARRGLRFDLSGDLPQMHANLAVEGLAVLKAAVEALGRPTEAGDERTVAQRHHDALITLATKYMDDGKLPQSAVQRPHVLLVVTPDGLHGTPDAAPNVIDGVGAVSTETAKQICCDADLTVITKDTQGKVLDAQPQRRSPTRRQRRAVIARDQACIGCGAPISRCEVHHMQWNRHQGPTTVENMTLVCWNCHRHIHHHGWQITRSPDGRYQAHPPDRQVDGTRIPHDHAPPGRRNTHLHDHDHGSRHHSAHSQHDEQHQHDSGQLRLAHTG